MDAASTPYIVTDTLPSRIAPLKLASVLAALGFIVGLYLALVHAPTDELLGEIQRVFYLHLASFAGALVGFITAVIGGLVYLRTRRDRWDMIAHAGVEVGMVLAVINVLTGMVYARAIINAWWTWDPKLTSVAIMVLTYASYLMLRNGVENLSRRRIFASIYGIFAFMTVINTFVVIRIRPDALHEPMFAPGSGLFAMPGETLLALFANMAIWGLLIAPVLIAWRVRLENALQEREARRLQTLSS